MKVGFVGLGVMGKPMCKNLLKAGYEVTAFDPFAKAALDEVVEAGAVRGESNADVASKSDVVITMVPNSPHVRSAVFDKGGIAEGAKEGLKSLHKKTDPLIGKATAITSDAAKAFQQEFKDAIGDDLNMPRALGIMNTMLKSDIDDGEKAALVADFDQIFGRG